MKIKLSTPATIFKTEYNAIQRFTNLMHMEGWWYGKQLHLVSHNWPEVSIGAEPFLCGFHQWSRVWTEYLRPRSLGVVILRSVHVRCSEQGCSEVTRYSTAEAPRNTWDSFYLELEYMVDDFVFRNFLLLTIFFFYKPYIRSHDLLGSWPTFDKLWSRWRWKAISLERISFFCLKDRVLSMLVKQQQQQQPSVTNNRIMYGVTWFERKRRLLSWFFSYVVSHSIASVIHTQ